MTPTIIAALLVSVATCCVAAADASSIVDSVDGYLYSAIQRVCARLAQPDSLLALLEKQQAPPAECIQHTKDWRDALSNAERWALRMVDSSSLSVPGLLYGNNADLGNFDECVTAKSGSGQSGQIIGRYSLVQVTVQTATPCSVHPCRNTTQWATRSSFRFALCSPKSCAPQVLDAAVGKVLQQINEASTEVRMIGVLSEDHSTVLGLRRDPDGTDWAIISLTLVLIFVVLLATVVDVCGTPEVGSGSTVVKMFSARENGRALLKISRPGGGNLSCINGIRTLSAFWIVACHRNLRAAGDLPLINSGDEKTKVEEYLLFIAFSQVTYAVDTFFTIGGIVNCYAFLRRVRQTNSFGKLDFVLRRLLRITPGMMFVLAVSATWFSLINNGPTWYMPNGMSQSCRLAWWPQLLYVVNFVDANQCHVMWYMATDMQLYLLSPLVLVPLWKYRRAGVYWLLLLTVAMGVVGVGLSYSVWTPSPLFLYSSVLYHGTQMRATGYLIGIVFGYLIHAIQVSKSIRFNPSRLTVAVCWAMGTAFCMLATFGLKEVNVYEIDEASFLSGLGRMSWAIGIGWVVLACVTSNGGPVNAFLSWSPFEVLGRISFGVYLTHNLIQEVDLATNRTPYYNNVLKAMEASFSDFFLASICASLLHLLVEGPTSVLSNLLLDGRRRRKHDLAVTPAKDSCQKPDETVDPGTPPTNKTQLSA